MGHSMTTTTIGPALSWRLIHDGTTVLMLAELTGITSTPHQAFEATTQRECVLHAINLGLVVPDELAEAFEAFAVTPERCSKRQGELALLEAGKLDAVEAGIAAITDPVAKRRAQIEYGADVWERDNPFLQGMWTALGGTSEELDDLFRLAVTL